jgi:benzoyl-CoA reductase/2-hydroxyglutaryl-CoA dehydratase subunit BcrC/BadD/HgdB
MKGKGVVEKGSPRIIMYLGISPIPGVVRMIENAGLSIPYTSLAATMSKYYKGASTVRGSELAEQEMARDTYHSVYGFVKRMEETMRSTGVDGLIWDYVLHCRPMSLPSHLLNAVIEKETKIPFWPSIRSGGQQNHHANSMRTRVETFAEICGRREPKAHN